MIKEIKDDNMVYATYSVDEGIPMQRHKWILTKEYVENRMNKSLSELLATDNVSTVEADIKEFLFRASEAVYSTIYSFGNKDEKEYWLSNPDNPAVESLLEAIYEEAFDTIIANKEKGILDDDNLVVTNKVYKILESSDLLFYGRLVGLNSDFKKDRGVTY